MNEWVIFLKSQKHIFFFINGLLEFFSTMNKFTKTKDDEITPDFDSKYEKIVD